jgi:hypothetical protein
MKRRRLPVVVVAAMIKKAKKKHGPHRRPLAAAALPGLPLPGLPLPELPLPELPLPMTSRRMSNVAAALWGQKKHSGWTKLVPGRCVSNTKIIVEVRGRGIARCADGCSYIRPAYQDGRTQTEKNSQAATCCCVLVAAFASPARKLRKNEMLQSVKMREPTRTIGTQCV